MGRGSMRDGRIGRGDMDELLSLKEAAAFLRITVHTMAILVRHHIIPAYSLSLNGSAPGKGRKEYRIKVSDLEAYLESRKV